MFGREFRMLASGDDNPESSAGTYTGTLYPNSVL